MVPAAFGSTNSNFSPSRIILAHYTRAAESSHDYISMKDFAKALEFR